MPTGRVKWFNNAKGYGFILPEGEGPDYFAHYSSILMDGYRTLKAGQLVSFDLLEGPKGAHAINIKVLEDGAQNEQH
ncbi:MAG: cold shock domain-containing protein CspD [Gammaproteobacteria bacterium]|nr:cold shock domain-containing protein CspD [Gammaproteobacteria bacterium]